MHASELQPTSPCPKPTSGLISHKHDSIFVRCPSSTNYIYTRRQVSLLAGGRQAHATLPQPLGLQRPDTRTHEGGPDGGRGLAAGGGGAFFGFDVGGGGGPALGLDAGGGGGPALGFVAGGPGGLTSGAAGGGLA